MASSRCASDPPSGKASIAPARFPERYYLPAYIGARGWFGLRLDRGAIDWREVSNIVDLSYCLAAPQDAGARAWRRAWAQVRPASRLSREAYLPMQKPAKIRPSRSSLVNSPVISLSACCAARSSSATSSPARVSVSCRAASSVWCARARERLEVPPARAHRAAVDALVAHAVLQVRAQLLESRCRVSAESVMRGGPLSVSADRQRRRRDRTC